MTETASMLLTFGLFYNRNPRIVFQDIKNMVLAGMLKRGIESVLKIDTRPKLLKKKLILNEIIKGILFHFQYATSYIWLYFEKRVLVRIFLFIIHLQASTVLLSSNYD